MRDSFKDHSRLAMVLATLGAVLLANLFFWGHGHILIHDAQGYYELSKIINQNGLFRFADDQHTMHPGLHILFELRTYGYPLFIALCSLFTNHEPLAVQIAVFNCQLLLCLAACFFCARALQHVFKASGFGTWLYVCTVLNPYVLIHTTEILSDLLSAVLTYLVFVLSLQAGLHESVEDNLFAGPSSGGWRRQAIVFLASFLAGLSALVRPANIAVIFALGVFWLIRALIAQRLSLRLSLVMILGLFIPFIPQLTNNYRNFHKIQPLVIGNVGGAELSLGCWYLKYATVVVDNEQPQLFYPNPFSHREISTPQSFLRKRPLAYAITLSLHAFALLDQDFPFTYIRDLHPWYRWPLSMLNYLFLAVSLYGMYLAVRRFVRRGRSDQATWGSIASLVMSACYLALYLPCQPESRYSLPVFFLWSPFFVAAILNLRKMIAYRRYLPAARVAACCIVFVGCCAWLSSWMQLQTPRLRLETESGGRFKSCGHVVKVAHRVVYNWT
jgi:hypothetical protein